MSTQEETTGGNPAVAPTGSTDINDTPDQPEITEEEINDRLSGMLFGSILGYTYGYTHIPKVFDLAEDVPEFNSEIDWQWEWTRYLPSLIVS